MFKFYIKMMMARARHYNCLFEQVVWGKSIQPVKSNVNYKTSKEIGSVVMTIIIIYCDHDSNHIILIIDIDYRFL